MKIKMGFYFLGLCIGLGTTLHALYRFSEAYFLRGTAIYCANFNAYGEAIPEITMMALGAIAMSVLIFELVKRGGEIKWQ